MTDRPLFRFQLYIVGHAPNSKNAILNLREICRSHLPERHEIELIDVQLHPERALTQGVLITPLLVRISPAPICRIAGNLSDHQTVIKTMISLF